LAEFSELADDTSLWKQRVQVQKRTGASAAARSNLMGCSPF
jgi:hypothetical protein